MIAVDSVPGVSVRWMKDDQIWFYKGKELLIWTHAQFIPSSAIHAQSELDSMQVEREWVTSIALNPPLGDADNCETQFALDTIIQYRNQYHLRHFIAQVKDSTQCTDGVRLSSHFNVHFLSVSRQRSYCLIVYFEFSPNNQSTEFINKVYDGIRIRD